MSLFSRLFKPTNAMPGATVRMKEPGKRSRMRGLLRIGATPPAARSLEWGMESALPRLALDDAPPRFAR